MGRNRSPLVATTSGVGLVREHQTTIFERIRDITQEARRHDPVAPAIAVLCCTLALMLLGLLVQASHAATTLPAAEFRSELREQLLFRCAALVAMLLAARIGPSGLRRFLPALTVTMAVLLLLVFVPPLGSNINGSNRWLDLGVVKFQPSELARIVIVMWVADRCVRLGPQLLDLKRGMLPVVAMGLLFFGLVGIETDLGGATLLLLCVFATVWIGGASSTHVLVPLTVAGAGSFLLAFTAIPYIRRRIMMFLSVERNQQVTDAANAIASGDAFGLGFAQGPLRNHGVPYLESDFVFAQIGEEFGLFGMLVVVGLFGGLVWNGLRLVLAIKDRFDALATFGLLMSTCLQGMLHIQIVAGLAPPKGMTLPFLSHGGTSLIVSSLGMGLALGAARRWSAQREQVVTGS